MEQRTCLGVFMLLMFVGTVVADFTPNYADALTKSILFFEGQRSGKLPRNQRMTWRKDSALPDGSDIGMDLSGGYYDAGDNLKFNFPMAFTTTMLAWSVIEFGGSMGPDLQHAMEAIRWGTDYFLKCTSNPNVVVVGIGEPYLDHNCWERPEEMDTPRNTYVINQTHPGTEVSGEIAAALAASSIALRRADPKYADLLVQRASRVFDFANNFRGNYNDSLGDKVCPFYCNWGGYMDELIWAGAWLYKATNNKKYWTFVKNNIGNVPDNPGEFGWDSKQAGGLLHKPVGSNMQCTAAVSFLALVYSKYLSASRSHRQVSCGNVVADPAKIVQYARSQIDYILGKNPLGMSYMVGYGQKFPQRLHHRASSLPSMRNHPKKMACTDGTPYIFTVNPNPNLLVGAVPGGPDDSDQFADDRTDFRSTEPTTYINAPLVGVLAYFKGV